jgi:hypothetical protein
VYRGKKSPFLQNKYTKDGCEGKKPLHRRKNIFCVFAYPCIGAKKSQPNELINQHHWKENAILQS